MKSSLRLCFGLVLAAHSPDNWPNGGVASPGRGGDHSLFLSILVFSVESLHFAELQRCAAPALLISLTSFLARVNNIALLCLKLLRAFSVCAGSRVSELWCQQPQLFHFCGMSCSYHDPNRALGFCCCSALSCAAFPKNQPAGAFHVSLEPVPEATVDITV